MSKDRIVPNSSETSITDQLYKHCGISFINNFDHDVVNQQGTSRDRLLSAITANRPSVEVYIEFLNEKDPQLMDQVRNSHNYELEHSPENTSVVLEKYIEENLIAFFYDSSLEVHTHEEKQIRQQNIQNYIISAGNIKASSYTSTSNDGVPLPSAICIGYGLENF